jgi:7-carboxy-7-deazaguanine synthase
MGLRVWIIDLDLLIHETFQQTVQGEGFHSGLIVDFIRLGGCSVGCRWCDTGYADGAVPNGLTRRSIDSLIAELKSDHCVVSGGEPFQQVGLVNLVDAIESDGRSCHLETSGVRWQNLSDSAWVALSPKEHISGLSVDDRFWERANEIKIVISCIEDFEFYQSRGYLAKKLCPIFLQPEWNNLEESIEVILELLKNSDIEMRLSLQSHKLIGVR